MDDLTIVVKYSGKIESLLKEHYHATGNNLQELINSCEERLPHDVHDNLWLIAGVRNDAFKQEGYKLPDTTQFLTTCKKCEAELQPRSAKLIWRFVIFLILAATSGAIWFYIKYWEYITGA